MSGSSRLQSPRVGWAILVVLLIGAFGLCLWDLNGPSIWHDEAWSIRAIRDPIGTPDDNTPPVYYGLMHLLWQGAGETPLALRYGSVLLDVITVALAARIVRQWAGWDAAILAVVFLSVSPLLWAYAREVRAYVGVPLLTLLVLWQADALLAPRARFPWRVWGSLLITELVLLYTHNLSVPVVAWLNMTVGGTWFFRREWHYLGVWIAGQTAALIAYLPWVLGQSPSGTPLNTPPQIGLALAWDIWQGYFAPIPAQLGTENALELGSAVFGVLALFSAGVVLRWNRNRHTLLLLSQAILIPALTTVELIVANIDFHPRYYLAGVPATLILIALGVDSLPEKFELRWAAIPAAMAVACGVGAASLPDLLDKPKYQHDDFRAIATYYAGLPADAIIVIPYGRELALEQYYADKVGIQAEIVGIELHSDAETAIAEINAALQQRDGPVRVELLTWYQLPADERGMYPCLLESAGRPGETFTVQGISTQAYTLTRPLALDGVPDISAATYGPINLVGAAFGGEQSICLRTTWALPQKTRTDWRVAGRIPTPVSEQWYIAESDTDIRRDDQAPTSQWKAGDQGEAFSLLRLLDGTPPGDYALQIRVYSQAAPHALTRLVDGVPTGGPTLVLGTVQPTGTTDHLPAGEPAPVFSDSDQGVHLIAHDAQGRMLSPGQELRVTLGWHVTGDCCLDRPWTGGTISLRDAEGNVLVQEPVAAYRTYSLDWHAMMVPAGTSGVAKLTVEGDDPDSDEPIVLAAYNIQETDHLFAPPPFDHAVGAVFPGLAVLEGFGVDKMTVSTDNTLMLTLVWRVTDTPDRSFTVFTHLLGADGQMIGGHDGIPAMEGTDRPATSWVPGEYIVDTHVLTFEAEDAGYRGTASLEVGLYDSETVERVRLPNGEDRVILLDHEITVP